MKPGVVIINTARGAVIDEDALVQALDSGKVLSAGLDVFEEEPAVHPGLVRNPNVMLVPHMGTWTVEVWTIIHLCVPFLLVETFACLFRGFFQVMANLQSADSNCHGGMGN